MAAGTANPPGQPGGFTIAAVRRADYGSPSFWNARPILMRLSAITPSPTQRLMPTSPRYRPVETMPPLGDADAPLAAGAPFLAVAEPTLLLLAFAFGALG